MPSPLSFLSRTRPAGSGRAACGRLSSERRHPPGDRVVDVVAPNLSARRSAPRSFPRAPRARRRAIRRHRRVRRSERAQDRVPGSARRTRRSEAPHAEPRRPDPGRRSRGKSHSRCRPRRARSPPRSQSHRAVEPSVDPTWVRSFVSWASFGTPGWIKRLLVEPRMAAEGHDSAPPHRGLTSVRVCPRSSAATHTRA